MIVWRNPQKRIRIVLHILKSNLLLIKLIIIKQSPKLRESKSKNTERIFQNVGTHLSLTMQMECVRTATMLKAEPRRPLIVNTMTEHYMPKVYARIATYLSTINVKGTPVKKVMKRNPVKTHLNNEITYLHLLRLPQ